MLRLAGGRAAQKCKVGQPPEFSITCSWTEADRSVRPTRAYLGLFAAAEVVDEHLFDGLVVGFEDVADGMAADEVADFFGEILGVIAGTLERLGHEDDLEAGLAGDVFGILDVAQKDQVAEAIDFGIRAENIDGFADVAGGEGGAHVAQHFFEDGGHVGEVAGVLGIDAAGGGLSAVGKAEKKIADALEADHELHAGEELTGLGGFDVRDDGGDGTVDFHIERVEFALALAQGVQQEVGAGSNALGGGSGGFLGETTGLDGATDNVMLGRLGSEAFDAGGTHEGIPLARTGAARANDL